MVLENCVSRVFPRLVDVKPVSVIWVRRDSYCWPHRILDDAGHALAIGLIPVPWPPWPTGEPPDGAARAAVQAIALALIISFVIALIGAPLAPKLLGLMGASPSVIAKGSGFTTVMLAATPRSFCSS